MLTEWFKSKKNPLKCFTKKNLDAIIFTSNFTANCIRHLLHNGIQFILTRRFSNDNIECFHGAVRHYCGSNDHLSIGQCLSAIDRMNRTQLPLTSMQCNTPLQTEKVLQKNDSLILKERKKKSTKQRTIKFLMSAGNKTYTYQLIVLSDYISIIPEACTCVYLSGYGIHKYGQLEDFCIDCYTKIHQSQNICD